MSDAGCCVVCAAKLKPTETQTCAGCVSHIRAALTDIETCYALLPDELEHHADAPLPGGDALVMLGPGSTGAAARQAMFAAPQQWDGEKWAFLDESTFAHLADWNPTDPPTVLFDLSRWQDDWADIRHEAVGPPAIADVVKWLGTRLHWAAEHHLAFDEFAEDMHRMATRLQVATCSGEWPLYGARCQYCECLLVRYYDDPKPCAHGQRPAHHRIRHPDTGELEPPAKALERWLRAKETWELEHKHCKQGGLTEKWRCPMCKRRYDKDEYRLALRRQAGASVGWMPLHLAADLAAVPQSTLHTWVQRLHVSAVQPFRWHFDPDWDDAPKTVRAGPLLVSWGDVLLRVAARKVA